MTNKTMKMVFWMTEELASDARASDRYISGKAAEKGISNFTTEDATERYGLPRKDEETGLIYTKAVILTAKEG